MKLFERTDEWSDEFFRRVDRLLARLDHDLPVGYRMLGAVHANLFGAFLLTIDMDLVEDGWLMFLQFKLGGLALWYVGAHYIYVSGKKSDWCPE